MTLRSSPAAIDLIVTEEDGDLTLARLKEVLHYDPDTGIFRWRINRRGYAGKAKAGAIAGSIRSGNQASGGGYIEIGIDGHRYLAHRLAWFYITGRWPSEDIDHKNRVRNENAFSKLREASRSNNRANSGHHGHNTSGVKGVRYRADKQKWLAFIGLRHKHIHLGYFDTKELAIEARHLGAVKYHGEFVGQQ